MSENTSKLAVLKPESMTIYEATELHTLFITTLRDYEQIEVDLSNVAEIDSAGLQLMVAFKNDAKKQKVSMSFTSHSREVIDLFDMFNMTRFFGDQVVL